MWHDGRGARAQEECYRMRESCLSPGRVNGGEYKSSVSCSVLVLSDVMAVRWPWGTLLLASTAVLKRGVAGKGGHAANLR